MQLASMFVRAARPLVTLDLGCGYGYSTFWLARATGAEAKVIGIDSDAGHVDAARDAADRLGFGPRVEFVVGEVADVLGGFDRPVEAIHDDAWFATAPSHLERMLQLLRPGGLLTMPNWFLLIDAITGQPRNSWERFAGPTWAADTIAYADALASRSDVDICWFPDPPLGVAVKAGGA